MLELPLTMTGALCRNGPAMADVNVFFKPVGAVLPKQFISRTLKGTFSLGQGAKDCYLKTRQQFANLVGLLLQLGIEAWASSQSL